MGKAKIDVNVELLDDNLVQAFIQHIRDFDTAHPNKCHVKMTAVANGKTLAEMEAIFAAIEPPFVRLETHRKQ